MGFLNILLYMLLTYMILNMFMQSRRAGKTNVLVELLKMIDDKDAFFAKADQMIAETESEVAKNKYRVLRLYGRVCHKMYDSVVDELNEIDLDALLKDGDMTENEDSFFYLYITLPMMLHGDGRDDLRAPIREKLAKYDETLDKAMLVRLSRACDKFFDQVDDLGKSTFYAFWEGDYAGLTYNKQLIGVYKNICASCLAWFYKKEDNTAEYEDLMSILQDFANTGIGEKWLKALDLYKEFEEEDEEIADNVSDVQEVSDNIIDVEVKEHEGDE